MSCYCDYDYSEFPTLYAESTVKARREHRCCECLGVIKTGESYQRRSGKWEGQFRSFKTCQRCVDFEANIKAHIPCFRVCSIGDLIEDAVECLRDYREEASTLLFGAYRRDILRRRNATAIRAARRLTPHP
ncbi:hypothetical protein EHZ19_28295 [Paraburkholderia bannensis]|nr:hypothetical protein [Paraburkholderia bannensis]RQM44552.1 hypothetical protein EHZ19_28295 [Paraburkholderia bannensis]